MKKAFPILILALLAGCGQSEPSKFFDGFDLESLLKKACEGVDCKIEEVGKGNSQSKGVFQKRFKYLVQSENVGAAGLMTAVRNAVAEMLGEIKWGDERFTGKISSDFAYDYDTAGKRGFVRIVFVNVQGGVYVLADVRETD